MQKRELKQIKETEALKGVLYGYRCANIMTQKQTEINFIYHEPLMKCDSYHMT